MTRTEKEAAILKRLHQLQQLDNVGHHGYLFIDILEDIIAEEVFGSECKHNLCGEVIYLEGSESCELKRKIAMVIRAMDTRGIIRISKSKKMFKILCGGENND